MQVDEPRKVMNSAQFQNSSTGFHGIAFSSEFALPRVRTLIGLGVIALIATTLLAILIFGVHHHTTSNLSLEDSIIQILFDLIFLLLLIPFMSKSWRPALVLGLQPTGAVLRLYWWTAFPLAGIAIASVFALYLPLSYILPRFVEWHLLDQPLLVSTSSASTNLFAFLCVVVITPVFEEFVFRGLLLTRWTIKWNVRKAVFLSSAVFAIGHADIIGAFFVGYAMCAIYVETRSLLIPIGIHMVNNGTVWILEAINVLYTGSDAPATLPEWQSFWWVGLLSAAVCIPWAIAFVRRQPPMVNWRLPYMALQRTGEHQKQG